MQWPLGVLVSIGVLVRIVVSRMYYPALMQSFDSPRYARVDMALFGDFWMPAGYPMLLQLLHVLSHHLWFTIAIQHVMGVIVGVLLFLASRSLGLSRALALLPAGVALLSGDHLYLEHQIMADSTLIFWLTIGLTAAIIGLIDGSRAIWLSIAGLGLSCAALTRSVAIFSLPIFFVCCALFTCGTIAKRGKVLVVPLVSTCAVFATYVAACKIGHGQYIGLADMRGWNLYCRVAPFADCRQFTPPTGTEVVCETRPAAERPGPFGYVWDASSVPRQHFALAPETGAALGAFARQAILHQPFDYLSAVIVDLARYVEPWSTSNWHYAGQPPGILSFGWYDKSVEQVVVQALSKRYRGTHVRAHGKEFLAWYQNTTRVTGFILLALIALSIAGMFAGRTNLRLGSTLFGLTAFALYVVPVLTYSYDFRYGVPPVTFLVVAGMCGAASVWPRLNGEPLEINATESNSQCR